MSRMSYSGKRLAKILEDTSWDCSLCTFRNKAEAFKCLMCDVRRGTSTRKPKINPQLAAQQVFLIYICIKRGKLLLISNPIRLPSSSFCQPLNRVKKKVAVVPA